MPDVLISTLSRVFGANLISDSTKEQLLQNKLRNQTKMNKINVKVFIMLLR